MFLGRPMNELSNMDGSSNAAATENNYAPLSGDIAAGMGAWQRGTRSGRANVPPDSEGNPQA